MGATHAGIINKKPQQNEDVSLSESHSSLDATGLENQVEGVKRQIVASWEYQG